MTKTTLRWSVSACALITALASGQAYAQTVPSDPPPPLAPRTDANGVDLVTGAFDIAIPQSAIGAKGGGLTRVQEDDIIEDNFYGAINSSGSTYTVSVGNTSDTFTLSGGVYTSQQADGATLAQSGGIYTYTARDGTIDKFSTAYAGTSATQANVARIVTLTLPTGYVQNFTYQTQNVPFLSGTIPVTFIGSVTDNRGLQIKYNFSSSSTYYPSSIVGVNNSVEYCSPQALSCSFANTWPTTTTSLSGNSTISATDALGRVTTYPYPIASSTQTVTLPSGEKRTVVYDSSQRVTSYSNGIGTWTYSYATSGTTQTTTVTDPNGHKKIYVSNTPAATTAPDVITSYTDALNRRTSYGYDGNGRLTSVSLPHGDSYAYSYDARGNLTQTVHTPAGGGTAITTSASYDTTCTYPAKCNKPNTTTDAKGNVTSYTYDNTYGVLLTVTKPAIASGYQPQARYSYTLSRANILNAAGQTVTGAPIYLLTGISSCNKQPSSSCVGTSDETRVTIAYDPNHNLAPMTMTTSAGDGSITSTQSLTYDAFGNLATSTNPLGGVSSYFYDADRELVAVAGPDPDGSGPRTPAGARITYTADGLVGETEAGTLSATPTTDASFNSDFSTVFQATSTFDAADRLTQSVTSGYGSAYNTTQYQYDGANNLVCTAVRMNIANFGSEPAACIQGAVGTDGPDRITYRTYDNADELTVLTDGYGSSSQRTAQSNTYSGSDGTLVLVGDGKGNSTCLTYDGFSRATQVNYPTPSSGGTCNPSDYDQLTYDADSNVTQRRFRDGSTMSYTYDADNDMTSDGVSNYTFDQQGRIVQATNANFTSVFTFDALGRKTAEKNNNLQLTSTYDAAGDRKVLTYQDGLYVDYDYDLTGAMIDARENGATSGIGVLATYSYDGLGRLNGINYGSGVGSDSFADDGDGRLGSYTHTFSGDSTKNQVVGLNYNPANQLRTRTYSNTLYEWTTAYNSQQGYGINGLNQIATAGSSTLSYNARGSLANDSVNTYGYTPYNQLTTVSGSANATLSYDPTQRLVQTQGSATTRFVYDGSMIAEETDSNNNILRRYIPGADGTPLAWYEGSSTSDRRFLLKDQAGTVQAVMNASGASDGINTYDAYGLNASSNIGRFQFAGRPWVPEAGLYDNAARSYSPTLGRFLQTDPTGYSDGMNWYAYTHDDPVNGTDPSGLLSLDDGLVDNGFDDIGDQLYYPAPGVGIDPDTGDSQTVDTGNSNDETPSVSEVTVTGMRLSPVSAYPALTIARGGGGLSINNAPLLPQTVQEVVVTAKRIRSVIGCASAFASRYSISTGLQNLGVNQTISDVIGGNIFSGIHDLGASLLHGSGGGHSMYYNATQAFFAGPALGLSAPLGKLAPKLGEAAGGFSDTVSLALFGAEAASGIAEAKLLFDGGTFLAGAAFCAAGAGG